MTDQPRDLAAEVAEDIRNVEALCNFAYEMGFHELGYNPVSRLACNIAALSRELEEHREALRWALDNDAGHCIEGFTSSGGECCITLVDPPAHLAPILAGAMRSKP